MKNKVLLLTLLMSLSGCAIMPLSSSSSINSNDNDKISLEDKMYDAQVKAKEEFIKFVRYNRTQRGD